jgi:hypothetical protein
MPERELRREKTHGQHSHQGINIKERHVQNERKDEIERVGGEFLQDIVALEFFRVQVIRNLYRKVVLT